MSLNDFIFGKILGKGSFGTVNIVTRKQDNKIYAMKRVNISSLSDKDKQSSLNEIRILASLQHPNIIGYKEAFFDDETKTLNIVMEYAEEGDIENKVKENFRRHLRISENTIWEWLIQILEGLKYLHDNKIMHRDLKCANIFITKNGILKLGDLNVSIIAKLGMAKTQTGTPYYCSPEIWRDKPYNYKSDIWSLGCILYELCQLRPPFRGTNLRELSRNVISGFYLPISNCYSDDLKRIIAMMLVVDANKRASTDEILQHPILQKRIQRVRKNIITREVEVGRSKKVNFMETIKLPRNMKDINSKLPKKRYRPEDEMMENDEYETMKATFFKEVKKQNSNGNNNINNYNNIDNNRNGNNNYNFGYDNMNKGNYMDNRQLINNYIRKNEFPDDNRSNNRQYNNQNNDISYQNRHYNNKYAYLNKFDNNMNPKTDDNKNNNNYRNDFNNNRNNYNYHYNEKINNNFNLLFNNNFEKKYNGNMEKNYEINLDNMNKENNLNRMQNDNYNIYNAQNNNYIENYNILQQPQQDNVNKYFQLLDKFNNNNIPQYQNKRNDIPQQRKLEIENIDNNSEYSNDSDIIKEEYKVKKNQNLINDYLNKINILDNNIKNNNQNKYDLYNFDYNKKNNNNSNGNCNNKINENYENNMILNMQKEVSNGINRIKEHEIEKEKEMENDKTKDLKIQMAKNQDLFDDLLNNPSSENKMNIGENELFRINIPQNNNNKERIYNEENKKKYYNINTDNQNYINDKNNQVKNNNIYKSEVIYGNDLNLNIRNENNNKEENKDIKSENNNKKEINMLLHYRLHRNNINIKNNNNYKVKNIKKENKRGITPNHLNKNDYMQMRYNNNNINKINNNLNSQNNNLKNVPVPTNKNKKDGDKYKKIFNEIKENFPTNNKYKRNNKNMRPETGKPKNIIRPKNNFNNKQNDYSNYNERIRNNNYNINYNNNNINNYNNIYINNINNNDKFDYNQLFNNKNNNIKYNYNPSVNNNKGYIVQSEQMNNFRIFNNNNYYNNNINFKFEPVKRNNNKILYEKYNYIENPKRNNIEQNYGFGIQKNNRNDLYKMQNNNNINQNNKYNNNGNKNINRKNNNKNEKMNHPRIKTGGGRANQLRKKFGFN